jgi:hypothetical protein
LNYSKGDMWVEVVHRSQVQEEGRQVIWLEVLETVESDGGIIFKRKCRSPESHWISWNNEGIKTK